MSVIKKQILVGGSPHYVEISSSLELEEVEITGTDPASGKTVHISLSSMLKPAPKADTPSPLNPQPLEMPLNVSEGLASLDSAQASENVDAALKDLFSH